MSNIQIVTDSIIDLPKDIIEKYGIIVAPLTIIFGDEEYRDGVDLTSAEFYERLKQSSTLPKTSQVSPSTFINIFKEIHESGKEILCINGSSKGSGTYQSAMIAKDSLEDGVIEVFDTMSYCFGAGLYVYEAAKLVEEGKSLNEIINKLNEMKLKVDHIFTVDTLEFLKKGGRLNPMKAALGTMLNIKPILTVKDGLIEQLDKVRGSKKVIGKMIEIAKSKGMDFSDRTIGVCHANNPEAVNVLKDEILRELNPKEVLVSEIGCTVGAHAGPGTLAIFYISK